MINLCSDFHSCFVLLHICRVLDAKTHLYSQVWCFTLWCQKLVRQCFTCEPWVSTDRGEQWLRISSPLFTFPGTTKKDWTPTLFSPHNFYIFLSVTLSSVNEPLCLQWLTQCPTSSKGFPKQPVTIVSFSQVYYKPVDLFARTYVQLLRGTSALFNWQSLPFTCQFSLPQFVTSSPQLQLVV